NYTGGYEYLNIKWSISMHLMVYFNASGGSKVSIDGPFEMQYSLIIYFIYLLGKYIIIIALFT
ncbi:hypothetical protein, partial [Alkalibaculum bacchi]|uniref:hypothetical protein n=1 Tax=Alkalibaculum bacchi TaxID=645887 RepID=UPI001A9BE5E9